MSHERQYPVSAPELTKRLIGFKSVTPDDDGAQAFLTELLTAHGFICHDLTHGRQGRNPTPNLVALHGSGAPHLAFNGHTDVVDPGEEALWTMTKPFEPLEQDGYIYGRGAEDMKGGLSAAVMAAIEFVHRYPNHLGTVSLLITGDEETDGYDGTPWIAEWMEGQGLKPDACVIPEPASHGGLGRTVRVGSRGCYEAKVKVFGVQGHSAYEHLAVNPIHAIGRLLDYFRTVDLDHGHGDFQATSVQVVSITAGNMSKYNIIPGDLTFNINVRYTDLHTTSSLEAWLRRQLHRHGLQYEIVTSKSFSEPYITPQQDFTTLVSDVMNEQLGVMPEFSVLGGASDARVMSKICPTVEIGPTHDTLHKVNERVSVEELFKLQQVYVELLTRFLVQQ